MVRASVPQVIERFSDVGPRDRAFVGCAPTLGNDCIPDLLRSHAVGIKTYATYPTSHGNGVIAQGQSAVTLVVEYTAKGLPGALSSISDKANISQAQWRRVSSVDSSYRGNTEQTPGFRRHLLLDEGGRRPQRNNLKLTNKKSPTSRGL